MVSILIPTHRRPGLLVRALRSVQAQALEDWEALVIDEGEGLQVALNLGDGRIRAYPNLGKGGVAARNTALGLARGEVIALLDDDDRWEDPYHLHRVLKALRAGPGLAYRGGYLVQEREGIELERLPFDFIATPERMRQDNLLLASAVAYPRSLHEELGPFDLEMGDYWDWDWYLRVVAAGYPLLRIAGKGVAIGIHGGNASYQTRFEERQRNLAKLCAKHALVGVSLKDHRLLVTAA
jgi:glycosyltransferase involved in cell wall biosynthesis